MRWQSLIWPFRNCIFNRAFLEAWLVDHSHRVRALAHSSMRVNPQEPQWLPLTQEAHKTTGATDRQCSAVTRETGTAHPVHY